MCLVVKNDTEILSAKEDITVYKTLRRNLKSLYHNHQYELNKLSPTRNIYFMKFSSTRIFYADSESASFYLDIKEKKVVSEGFHFYSSLDRIGEILFDEVIVECTIPKGSKYVLDETGLGVASRIIINNIINEN